MRFPPSADFPPPSPANDRFGFVQWRADALRRAPARRRQAGPRRSLLLEGVLPLGLLMLVLWAASHG